MKEIDFKKNFFPEKCSIGHIECSYVKAAGKFLLGLRENLNQSLKIVKEKVRNLLQNIKFKARNISMDRYKAILTICRKFLAGSTKIFRSKSEKIQTQKSMKHSFTQIVPLDAKNAVFDTMPKIFFN